MNKPTIKELEGEYDKIPKTLNAAIDELYSRLTEDDISFIKKNDNSKCHHYSGMQMRNDWDLWNKNSPLNKDVQQRFKLSHGDDMSGLIYEGLWARVKGNDVDTALQSAANRYIKHWNEMGVDPLTGQDIPNVKKSSSMTLILNKNGVIDTKYNE